MMFCEDASDTLKMADFNTPPDMAIADENVIGRYEALEESVLYNWKYTQLTALEVL